MRSLPRFTRFVFSAGVAAALAGCATVSTLAEHGSLTASTKMSSSVFLDPTARADQTVFLQVRNTTDKGSIGLSSALAQAIQAKGWTVVDDPAKANVILQVNVLQAGEIKQNALQAALLNGYGGVLGSAGVGAATAALAGGDVRAVGATGLAVGAADYVGSLLVKDVTYSVITDVRVLQRGKPGQTFTVTHNVNANSGTSANEGDYRSRVLSALLGGSSQSQSSGSSVSESTGESYTEKSDYKIHQTRVVSYADKANLTWDEALPAIKKGLVNTLSGLF